MAKHETLLELWEVERALRLKEPRRRGPIARAVDGMAAMMKKRIQRSKH